MNKKIFSTLICIGLFSFLEIHGQNINKNKLEITIDSLVPKEVKDNTPGLVIGIVKDGELLFSKGYGLANISYNLLNDNEMLYNIGSVSKQFLGYAFAMLHVEGKLNIDDSVNKYLDEWPEFNYKVTLRHLLSHTSGYREAYSISNLAGRTIDVDRLTRKECLEVVRRQPELEFIPGSRWVYNSTAWVILAEVLKKVTGQEADKWVEENILKPLRMDDTQIENFVGEVIINTAESYSFEKEKGFVNKKSNRAIFGAADIYTNIKDLVNWINNYKTMKIGGKAVNKIFLKPHILNDGANSEYALGIVNDYYKGLKRYTHTGSHEEFLSQISYYPDHDLGIIVISNFGSKGFLPTTKIADLLLKKHMKVKELKEIKKIEIKKNSLKEYAGLYMISTFNETLNLKVLNGVLAIDGETKLIPVSRNTFRVKGWSGQIHIEKSSKGEIILTTINGTKETYTKIERWNPTELDLEKYVGDYWSDEIETVYHIHIEKEKLIIKHRWLNDIVLKAISHDLFQTNLGYNVKFIRNKKGKVLGLSIYGGRTQNVFFQRK